MRKSFTERRPGWVGILSILLIASALAGAFSINKLESLRGVYSISADLRDAAGVVPGNEVRIAGVKVGKVTGVRLTRDAARIDMEISTRTHIPVETRAEVKLKTLLGQKFIELRFPRGYIAAASGGRDAGLATAGYMTDGDVIPLEQTEVPFEIYQAATAGTRVLQGVDKRAVRSMIDVLGDTVDVSKEELGRALASARAATDVLDDKSGEISQLLRSAEDATATLAAAGPDLGSVLERSEVVLGTLAERRRTISSLLAATEDLSGNLALLIRISRGAVDAGAADLDSILLTVEGELDVIEAALDDLGLAQKMFAQPLSFGRFTEGHVCTAISANTCSPKGSPAAPGVPAHGNQPEPESAGRR